MIFSFFQLLYFLNKFVLHRFYNSDKAHPEDDNCWNVDVPDENELRYSDKMQPGSLKRRYSDDDYEESKATVKFSPPAYIQRYQTVQSILTGPAYSGKLKKIVDFGCSELGFFLYLKHMVGVEEMLFVDIDRFVLQTYKEKIRPLHVDYIHTRERPLTVRILEGNVSEPDKLLEKCDAVVCIELVEHLYPETLTKLPHNIFGFIRPKVAIITTPNAEFNVLFKNMSKFRHPDHKFEWTRTQFEDWGNNIVSRFPEYSVSFHGICNGPPGTEDLGSCTQMAIFHKIKDLNVATTSSIEGLYKVVDQFDYPYKVDNRSDEEKILDDAVYFIRKFSLNQEEITEEIPLEQLLGAMSNFCISSDDLKKILENGNWTVASRENGPVVLVPPPSPFSTPSIHSDFSDHNLTDYSELDIEEQFYDWNPNHSLVEIENENWGSSPHVESENHLTENTSIDTNVANGIPSINQDDVCLDDVATESQSNNIPNSTIGESIIISSFSETKNLEKSETSKNSGSQEQITSILADSEMTEASTSFFSTQSLEESKLKNLENNSLDKSSSICSMFLEPSNISEDMNLGSLDSLLETTVTSPSVDEIFKSFKFNNTQCPSIIEEINFKDPKYTSSPHVSTYNSEKEKINKQIPGIIDSEFTAHFNKDLLLQIDDKLNDNLKKSDSNFNKPCTHFNDSLKMDSNCRYPLGNNDSENLEELKNCTSEISKNFNGKTLDTSINAQRDTKLEVSHISESLTNSCSLEIMDSGYPNSNSTPDSSIITHDNTSVLESSISNIPGHDIMKLSDIENRDFANSNLNANENNIHFENNQHINNFQPLMNVVESDRK